MDTRALTALKDGMERYKTTVKDSKFAPLRKKVETCIQGFPKQLNSTSVKAVDQKTVDECIALACQSIATTSTDAIIRAALDILEVVLSFELAKDSKAAGTVLRSICATPRNRGDDLTHKLLRNLSRCEVHHFVDVQVFELICSTIFELLNQSALSSSIDASCRAGLAHLLSNRLVRYQQQNREEGESDEIVGTPDYVVSVVLMKATEIEATRADTFFDIVANLFRECPQILTQPKSADLVLRHVLPRCLGRPRHPTALTILGSIVAVFENQALPFADIIFQCALIPALGEVQTAVDVMTVFLDSARKPAVLAGILSYYDCSGGVRPSLLQEWVQAVCVACENPALKNIRASIALLLQHFVDFFSDLYQQEPRPEVDELVKKCEQQTASRVTALLFNEDAKKGVAQGVKSGVIGSNSPEHIAKFLRASAGYLDKVKLGEYIAKRERKDILIAFVNTFDFAGLEFSEGIRQLMGVFKMVGEADIVDRTTDYYAARYVECNPGSFLQDTAAVLAFSTMMLNTDRHSPHVKTKMQMEEFVKNNRGIDNGKDLPREVLEGIFKRIAEREIVLEGTLSSLTPAEAAAKAREIFGTLIATNDGAAAVASSSTSTSSTSSSSIHLDKRIATIVLTGVIPVIVKSVSELLVTTSSREPAIKAVSKLISIVCSMKLRDTLKEVVQGISTICENAQFSSALRLSTLNLLIDSVLEHLSQFTSSWPSVARSVASCAQFGADAERACEKLVTQIQNLDGESLSAFVAGFIEISAESADFLTPDSFLWRLVTRAVEYTCNERPDLWKSTMWNEAFPQIKKAIFHFPNNQCADALDRLCAASLVASPQCLELVLFVCRAFFSNANSSHSNYICLTFMRTISLVELSRCNLEVDFTRLTQIYDTLARAADVDDLRQKAFASFKSNVLDIVMDPDFTPTSSSGSSLSWKTKAMKVTSTFASCIASGSCDDALFSAVAIVAKEKQTRENILHCCGCMTDLITSSDVQTKRRREAMDKILSLYAEHVDKSIDENNSTKEQSAQIATAIVGEVLIPLFETLIDSVAALYAKIARIRVAAGRERSASLANNNNNAPTVGGAARRNSVTTANAPATTTRTARGATVVGSSSATNADNSSANHNHNNNVEIAKSQSEADFQASSEAAIAAHVGLLVRLFNSCVPLSDEDVSPFRREHSMMTATLTSNNSISLDTSLVTPLRSGDDPRHLLPFETVFLVDTLKCALRSQYECTQQVAMVAIRQMAHVSSFELLDESVWKKVTDLLNKIIVQTAAAFNQGESMHELHMRFWVPLLSSVYAHAEHPARPSPLASGENGKLLSKSLSSLLASCSRSRTRNTFILDFEKDVLKIASQIAVASEDFDRVGDIGQTISNSLLESNLPHSNSSFAAASSKTLNNNNYSPSISTSANNNNAANAEAAGLHAVRSATQFVEWIAHIENMELFVATVRSAYPSLCDLMKCGDCSVGTALSLVFHRLAPVVVGTSLTSITPGSANVSPSKF